MSLQWNGDARMIEVRTLLGIGLRRATEDLANRVRHKLSTPSPPVSQPGRPPGLRTGRLRDSVQTQLDTTDRLRPVGYVQATAPYAEYLERGTTNMAARPFLAPAVREQSDIIARFFRT